MVGVPWDILAKLPDGEFQTRDVVGLESLARFRFLVEHGYVQKVRREKIRINYDNKYMAWVYRLTLYGRVMREKEIARRGQTT